MQRLTNSLEFLNPKVINLLANSFIDQLLFAVPMLAPYTTVNTFKYKAKVQPGTLKRGRA